MATSILTTKSTYCSLSAQRLSECTVYLLLIQLGDNSESQFKDHITVRAEQLAYLLIQKVVMLNSETMSVWLCVDCAIRYSNMLSTTL
jgi:hypothetical protein